MKRVLFILLCCVAVSSCVDKPKTYELKSDEIIISRSELSLYLDVSYIVGKNDGIDLHRMIINRKFGNGNDSGKLLDQKADSMRIDNTNHYSKMIEGYLKIYHTN